MGKRLTEEIAQPGAELSLWWMGQLGFAARMGPARLFFDVFLSPRPDRLHTPVCAPEDIGCADLFFGSHDHADHIDRAAWPVLAAANPQARFVVPRPLAARLSGEMSLPASRFLPLSDGETVRAALPGGETVEITGVASAHERLQRDPATGGSIALGFAVRCAGRSLYHSGDTCLYEGLETALRRLGPFDAMILPINGRDARRYRAGCLGNMTYQEAADLFGALRPGLCLPGHYELFQNNREDPWAFYDYLDAKYPGLPAWIGPYGEEILVPRPGEGRSVLDD